MHTEQIRIKRQHVGRYHSEQRDFKSTRLFSGSATEFENVLTYKEIRQKYLLLLLLTIKT